MKPQGTKSVNIRATVHREIDLESSRLGKPIYSVVDDAWEAYKKAAYQLTPEAAEKDSELIARFLRLWYKPEGIEVHIRDLLAKTLGVDPPKME